MIMRSIIDKINLIQIAIFNVYINGITIEKIVIVKEKIVIPILDNLEIIFWMLFKLLIWTSIILESNLFIV